MADESEGGVRAAADDGGSFDDGDDTREDSTAELGMAVVKVVKIQEGGMVPSNVTGSEPRVKSNDRVLQHQSVLEPEQQ